MKQNNESTFTKLPMYLQYQSISFLQYGELKFLERTSTTNRRLIQNFSLQKSYTEHVATLDPTLPNSYGIYTALEYITALELKKIKNYVKFNSYLGLGLFASASFLTGSTLLTRSWVQQLRSLYAEWDFVKVTINNITQTCKDYVAPEYNNNTPSEYNCTLGEAKCAFDYPCEMLNGKNETSDCRNLLDEILTLDNCGHRILYGAALFLGAGGMALCGGLLAYRLCKKSKHLETLVRDLPNGIIKRLFVIYNRNLTHSQVGIKGFKSLSIEALKISLQNSLFHATRQDGAYTIAEDENENHSILDIDSGSLRRPLLQ